MKLNRILATAALLATTAVSAEAQTSFIGSDLAFGTPDGKIFWSSLGASFTNVSNPFAIGVTGVPGLSAAVSQTGRSAFQRRDQGNGWAGNFASGDKLLWTNLGNGPISILFNNAIGAFGTQIQGDYYGAFLASISAFDAANVLLGSYTVGGNSNGAGDNSAIFVGISSTTGISRIELGVNTGGNDFAINDARINGVTTTPEPAALLLVGTGLAGLGLVRRRRRADA